MRFLLTPIFLSAALMLAGCDSASTPQGQAPDKVASATTGDGKKQEVGLVSANGMNATLSYASSGKAAPDVAFTGADGRDVTLADYKGRPLLVNIWATWCAPCKAEMPTLDALAALDEGKLTVLAVSQDLEGHKPVTAFFQTAKVTNLEPLTDKENVLSTAYGPNLVLPTTILYDSDGKEVWRITGGVEWDDEEMANLIAEAS